MMLSSNPAQLPGQVLIAPSYRILDCLMRPCILGVSCLQTPRVSLAIYRTFALPWGFLRVPPCLSEPLSVLSWHPPSPSCSSLAPRWCPWTIASLGLTQGCGAQSSLLRFTPSPLSPTCTQAVQWDLWDSAQRISLPWW